MKLGKKYKAYIQSKEWQAKRDDFFKSQFPKICCACHTPWRPGFHLHHRGYRRLGNERLGDLIMMCQECHKELHEKHSVSELNGTRLWGFTTGFCKNKRKKLGLKGSGDKERKYREDPRGFVFIHDKSLW